MLLKVVWVAMGHCGSLWIFLNRGSLWTSFGSLWTVVNFFWISEGRYVFSWIFWGSLCVVEDRWGFCRSFLVLVSTKWNSIWIKLLHKAGFESVWLTENVQTHCVPLISCKCTCVSANGPGWRDGRIDVFNDCRNDSLKE